MQHLSGHGHEATWVWTCASLLPPARLTAKRTGAFLVGAPELTGPLRKGEAAEWDALSRETLWLVGQSFPLQERSWKYRSSL